MPFTDNKSPAIAGLFFLLNLKGLMYFFVFLVIAI
jgi:hypothetical protein